MGSRPLGKAWLGRRPRIHHSDQGIQYAAPAYITRLKEAGVAISMAMPPVSGRGRGGWEGHVTPISVATRPYALHYSVNLPHLSAMA